MNNDLISRKDAINALKEDADWLAAQGSDWQGERLERDINILQELPAAKEVDATHAKVMLEITNQVRKRYVNLLDLIRYMQIDTIPDRLSEMDMKTILGVLNDYQAILQDYLK